MVKMKTCIWKDRRKIRSFILEEISMYLSRDFWKLQHLKESLIFIKSEIDEIFSFPINQGGSTLPGLRIENRKIQLKF